MISSATLKVHKNLKYKTWLVWIYLKYIYQVSVSKKNTGNFLLFPDPWELSCFEPMQCDNERDFFLHFFHCCRFHLCTFTYLRESDDDIKTTSKEVVGRARAKPNVGSVDSLA